MGHPKIFLRMGAAGPVLFQLAVGKLSNERRRGAMVTRATTLNGSAPVPFVIPSVPDFLPRSTGQSRVCTFQ
jgi:hypothetical protein